MFIVGGEMRVLAEKSVENGEVTLREAVGTLIDDFFPLSLRVSAQWGAQECG